MLIWQTVTAAEQEFSGVWVNDAYLRTLQRTHSPRTAVMLNEVPLARISADGKRLALSLNMHEMPEYAVAARDPANGAVRLADADDFARAVVFKHGALALDYAADGETWRSARFSRLTGNQEAFKDIFAQWVAERVLVGEYRDEQDRAYRFTPTEADWNGERFAYRVELDYVEFAPLDLLCRAGTDGPCQTLYGFVAAPGLLQIYTYDADTHRIGPLILDLTRQSGRVR